MNIYYISGFFDADGSITLCKSHKNKKFKSVKIDFTNTKKDILISIQEWLFNNNIKSYISIKPSRKKEHSTSYVLSCSYDNAYKLCILLKSLHPIKLHRINTVIKYYKKVTTRNGKYSSRQIIRKIAFERLFFCSIFQ